MMMPTNQQCPRCGRWFMGTDCIGCLCDSCELATMRLERKDKAMNDEDAEELIRTLRGDFTYSGGHDTVAMIYQRAAARAADEIERLRAVNKELLEACKLFLTHHNGDHETESAAELQILWLVGCLALYDAAIASAKAAIAKRTPTP